MAGRAGRSAGTRAGRNAVGVTHAAPRPHDATLEALAVLVATGVPVILWGDPGSGKSSAVCALAEAANLPIEVVIAAIREPSDFGGLPVVGPDGTQVNLVAPDWAVRLAGEGRGLLFLDEISTAPPAVQAALLRVVLERHVGSLALPAGVVIVAAANPPDQAAGGWDLAPPLANRFCHLEWRPGADVLADGLVGTWPAPRAARRVAGPAELAAARALVAAFVRSRPGLASVVPADSGTAGLAFPTSRTWEMVARLWAFAEAGSVSAEARALLVRGCVGEGAGGELLAWAALADLPDPEALLADPDSFTPLPRADRVHAVCAAVVAAVIADNTPARWGAAWAVLARVADCAPDVAATAARTLAASRPKGARTPEGARAFAAVLADAGLLERRAS